ncbi:MAG: hypothetical protein PVF45_12765 [Anaerolineae bacterium]|jgi:hypothetical protein
MSECPRLYHRRVPSAKLAAALEAFEDDFEYLYFESEATIELLAYRPPDPAWTHGRAFGPRLEVRWQRAGDRFDLLLLTETAISLPPGWEAISQGDDFIPHPDSADTSAHVMLWGTHVSQLEQPHHLAGGEGDVWIETRIPRPLRYPVPGSPKWVRARAVVYRCQGRPVLTRLASLEGGSHVPEPIW